MVPIVEEHKVPGLRSELAIATKPLPSKESPVVSIIETLHDSIAPRFSNRDEDHLDAQRKAKPEDDTKRARVTITSMKTEFVVDLKEVQDPDSLPRADQSQGRGLVVFCSLGVDKDAMTVKIHDMERIEATIVFDVS